MYRTVSDEADRMDRTVGDEADSMNRTVGVDMESETDSVIHGTDENDICCVVLAAGLSRRMGCDKLLLPLGASALLEKTLDAVSAAGSGRTIVVYHQDEIRSLAECRGFGAVFNGHPEEGQSLSVRLGLEACGRCRGWLFVNGDMPFLTASTIRKLLDLAAGEDKILVPLYGDHPGPPVYFPYRFRRELMALTGDIGGRSVYRRHPEDVLYVAADPAQGQDIDTPEDYAHVTGGEA